MTSIRDWRPGDVGTDHDGVTWVRMVGGVIGFGANPNGFVYGHTESEFSRIVATKDPNLTYQHGKVVPK